ncbi:MAG: hypothetical protein KGK01_09910 [Bradyrhizobium sp.]|uniref:hypothetical protein n=1 Tax=Bradyrhizobium sp. TaxID=376 RepID=UPI001C281963|nr:hypothetical protein [Bradyrhizobium sp.]MBU6464842.1 hypothetical protein [Pseudomonadota bacterium]MDE2069119.1 hypothetical protein [Bradyrhizobium sp.]MDE2242732.1 hypothetical protein [Bradyrhizobium sp.]MDE2468482.1 hypothetical protein [Bradyrhizobium sp.]
MTDTREAILFKKVSDGYVFRAPNPWLFGRGRFFLVNEAQKAQLLAIITARSPFANVMILITGFVVMYSASVAAIAFMTGHGEPSVGDTAMMAALALVCMYAALLICVRPAARRVQPLLAGLAPTDQRITAADCRLAAWKTTPLSGQFMLAASQVILSAMFFIQVMQKAGGNLAAVFDSGSAFSSAFAGSCFAFSSTCLLVTALKRFARRQQETAGADISFRKFLLPGFSLAISIMALGIVLYTGHVSKLAAAHRAKSFEISKRLGVLTQRIQDPSYSKRRVSIETRLAANTARMNALIGKLNHPTVRCDAAAIDDLAACTERARQEKQAVEAQIATTTKEAAALAKEDEAIQKEVAAFKAELTQIRAEMEANRADMMANGELRPTRSLN